LELQLFDETCFKLWRIKMPKSARIVDQNGFITIPNNPISKSGVFPYSGAAVGNFDEPNKIFNVYRAAKELDNEETLNSFKLLPFIEDHVMLGRSVDGKMPAEKKGVEGTTGNDAYFANDTVFSTIKIFSEGLTNTTDNGKKELSMGFYCKFTPSQGIFEGQSYDYIQTNIRGNHMALVDEGRMGRDVAVLDSMNFSFDAKEFFTAEDNQMTEEEKKALAEKEAKDAAEMKEKEDKEAKDAEEKEKSEKDKEAKDADEEKKKDDDDKKAGMDAIERVIQLEKKFSQLEKTHFKAVAGQFAQRDALASKLSHLIGSFDHAEKDLNEVAAYGVEKLGLKGVARGQEHAALAGYFHAKGEVQNQQSFGMDAKTTVTSNSMDAFLNGK
jgi:hypothetical protein